MQPGVGSMPSAAALDLSSLNLSFGSNQVLTDAGLSIAAGEVRGLVGANGSGKSSLVKILAGIYRPDYPEQTRCRIGGRPIRLPLHSERAHEFGLTFVHQRLGLLPDLPIVENIFLGYGYHAGRGIRALSWKRERERARQLLLSVGLDLDPAAPLKSLDRQQMVLVALARALKHEDPRVLVLDEPTAHLRSHEAARIHEAVRSASSRGIGVLYISHRLQEIFDLCDGVTVLRDGRVVWDGATDTTRDSELVELMAGPAGTTTVPGDTAATPTHARAEVSGRPVLRAGHVAGIACDDLSLEVRGGEIVGVTGTTGSGVEDVGRLLAGAVAHRSGSVEVDGAAVANSISKSIQAGIAFLPGDRAELASFPTMRVLDNMTVSVLSRLRKNRGITDGTLRQHALQEMHAHDVRPRRPDMSFGLLSGGNQQKALISRWLATEPKVFVIEEPTQGVDTDAKNKIYARIRSEASQGRAFILISSDEDELALLADRIAVMSEGRVSRILGRSSAEEIIAATQARATAGTGGVQ
jgi:ribose transport system ATP-binding protein